MCCVEFLYFLMIHNILTLFCIYIFILLFSIVVHGYLYILITLVNACGIAYSSFSK